MPFLFPRQKSPVHTYLESETGEALFTCERINRQGNFSAGLRKEAVQCSPWRCLGKQGQCSEITLWISNSYKQQKPLARLRWLQGTCRSLLCCLWIKTARSRVYIGFYSLSFITSVIHRHLSFPFVLLIFDFSILLSFNIFSMNSSEFSCHPQLPRSLRLHFLSVSFGFSSQMMNLFWLQSRGRGGGLKYRLWIPVMKCLWQVGTMNKRPFRYCQQGW